MIAIIAIIIEERMIKMNSELVDVGIGEVVDSGEVGVGGAELGNGFSGVMVEPAVMV